MISFLGARLILITKSLAFYITYNLTLHRPRTTGIKHWRPYGNARIRASGIELVSFGSGNPWERGPHKCILEAQSTLASSLCLPLRRPCKVLWSVTFTGITELQYRVFCAHKSNRNATLLMKEHGQVVLRAHRGARDPFDKLTGVHGSPDTVH